MRSHFVDGETNERCHIRGARKEVLLSHLFSPYCHDGAPDEPKGEKTNILVLEDDGLLAECLSEEVRSFGDTVIGPFANSKDALGNIASADAAILDVLADDGPSFAVADALAACNRPFVFLTGYDQRGLPLRFNRAMVYSKPSSADPLLRELHSRYGTPDLKQDNVKVIVVDMLAYARLHLPDAASAERLVERALIAAIDRIEQGGRVPDVRAMLVNEMERQIKLAKGRCLQ